MKPSLPHQASCSPLRRLAAAAFMEVLGLNTSSFFQRFNDFIGFCDIFEILSLHSREQIDVEIRGGFVFYLSLTTLTVSATVNVVICRVMVCLYIYIYICVWIRCGHSNKKCCHNVENLINVAPVPLPHSVWTRVTLVDNV